MMVQGSNPKRHFQKNFSEIKLLELTNPIRKGKELTQSEIDAILNLRNSTYAPLNTRSIQYLDIYEPIAIKQKINSLKSKINENPNDQTTLRQIQEIKDFINQFHSNKKSLNQELESITVVKSTFTSPRTNRATELRKGSKNN